MKIKNRGVVNLTSKPIMTLFTSALIGLCAGAIVLIYRYLLTIAEELCFFIYEKASENILHTVLLIVALIATGYLIGLLIKKFKMIGGSGIPQVKGILLGYFKDKWYTTMFAKMFGGTISAIAGLSLGREGPSIQLGACMADGISKKLGKTRYERKIYVAGGACAGLSAAFNAPLAGVMFCLEELFRYFSPIILLVTMTSAVVADFVAKNMFGLSPVFEFEVTQTLELSHYWLLPLLGILMGFSGAFYNFVLIKTKILYSKIKKVELRPIIPFACAAVLGLLFPIVLCGGHAIVEVININMGFGLLILILILKFVFSMLSFGSGAPGGIFFPLLVIGAVWGALFAKSATLIGVLDEKLFYNIIIFAMAGYFTAVVRAPITGIILLMEMTGSFTQLLPLTIVCLTAYITANSLKSPPIYDSLLESQVVSLGTAKLIKKQKKVNFDIVVQIGSNMDGKKISEIRFPQNCIIVGITRGEEDIIPVGNTEIFAEDILMFMTNTKQEAICKAQIEKLASL